MTIDERHAIGVYNAFKDEKPAPSFATLSRRYHVSTTAVREILAARHIHTRHLPPLYIHADNICRSCKRPYE